MRSPGGRWALPGLQVLVECCQLHAAQPVPAGKGLWNAAICTPCSASLPLGCWVPKQRRAQAGPCWQHILLPLQCSFVTWL